MEVGVALPVVFKIGHPCAQKGALERVHAMLVFYAPYDMGVEACASYAIVTRLGMCPTLGSCIDLFDRNCNCPTPYSIINTI